MPNSKKELYLSPLRRISTALFSRTPRRLTFIVPLLIMLLAFALRVFRLADANVWWDEGWTIWLSRYDLVSIALRTARDEHPPLHYWLMHYWNALAGTDAFAGRFFSVFFGVLTVAVVYRLTKKFGGKGLGMLAALLLASARFHIWWSQDIKNYTLSGFFAWLAVYFAFSILSIQRSTFNIQHPPNRHSSPSIFHPVSSSLPWLGYVLAMTLALYSHYLAALIFLVNNLFALIVILFLNRRDAKKENSFFSAVKRDLAKWFAAQLAVLALFAPWLWLYLQNAASWTAAPPFDFGIFLQLAATVLSLGITTNIETYAPLVIAISVIALLGIGWSFARGSPENRQTISFYSLSLFGLLGVAIPPLLIYVLSLTPAAFFAPKIQARYLLILLPGFILLLALGIFLLARFSKYVAFGVCVLLVLAQGWTLNDYFGTRVLRDEYFSLANVVNSFALAGDAVLLNTDQEWPTYLYYQRVEIPWSGVPNATPVTDRDANDLANYLGARYDGVWLVTIPDALAKDPQHLVEKYLARIYPKQYDRVFGDKRLTLYARTVHNVKDVPRENFWTQHPRADDFASNLRLVGFDSLIREALGGDTIHVVTYWAAEDLANIALELQDANGAIVRSDTQPISIGAHERVQSDLTLPPRASGEYTVVARAKLIARTLATLQVTPRLPPLNAQAISHPLAYRLGDSLHLVGFDLLRADMKPGDVLALTLYWQSDRAVATSYKVFVHLVGNEFNPATNNPLWGQVDQIPLAGELPTTAWDAGDVIPDAYSVPLAANAPAGDYQIAVGLYDPATGARLRVFDSNGQDAGDEIVIARVQVR